MMGQNYSWYVDLSGLQLSDADPTSIVHALPVGKYSHPIYGEMDFTPKRIKAFADSVVNNVRGVDPDIDYDHKMDPAKGRKAAGWVKAAEAKRNGLFLTVEWTLEAASAIRNKEYRYFSAEFADDWEDPQGNKHTDVLFGGAITNRPFLKNLLPINLSELSFETNTGGNGMSFGKLVRTALNLSETASDEEVMTKLTERLADPKPKDPKPEGVPKELAEHPAFKALMEQQQSMQTMLAEQQQALRLSETVRRLGELQQGNGIALTPVLLDAARDLAMAVPTALSDKVFDLLKIIQEGNAIVTLGEIGHVSKSNKDTTVTASSQLSDAIAKYQKDHPDTDYASAMEHVLSENSNLYDQYRKETYIA